MPHVASPSPQHGETPLDRLELFRAQEAVSYFLTWLNGHLATFQYPSEDPDTDAGIHAAESLIDAWKATLATLNDIREVDDNTWPLWSKLLPWFMQQKSFVEMIYGPDVATGRSELNPALKNILNQQSWYDLKGRIEEFLQQCDTVRDIAVEKITSDLCAVSGPKGVLFDSITVQRTVDVRTATTTLRYELWGSEYGPDPNPEVAGEFKRETCRWNPTLEVQHDASFAGLGQVSMINNALYSDDSGELRPLDDWLTERSSNRTHGRGLTAAKRYLLAACKESWGQEYFDEACSTLHPQPVSAASLSQHEAELLAYL